MRAFERAGIAGCHLEDQVFPKRCGHYDDKAIVSQAEMAQKIRAVKDASHDPDFVLIARTDRSEEHTSELQSLMRISYAVFCLKKNKNNATHHQSYQDQQL